MFHELPDFKFVRARSAKEAVTLLKKYEGRAKLLAGGTDLLGLMKDRVRGPKMSIPEVLIGISTVPELRLLEYDAKGDLSIGSSVTLREIEESKLVSSHYPAISVAAREVATSPIKNQGTLGGNLCQRPWCWYFRSTDVECYKKGGPLCPAITGENKYYFSILGLGPCVMAHPSDIAVPLTALDASLTALGVEGSRVISMSDFFLDSRHVNETVLSDSDVIVSAKIPAKMRDYKAMFIKVRPRETWDFAVASVAVAISIDENGKCTDSRVVLGGVAPFPFRSSSAEKALNGAKIDGTVAQVAGKTAAHGAHPLRQNGYKKKIAEGLVAKAVLSCCSPPPLQTKIS